MQQANVKQRTTLILAAFVFGADEGDMKECNLDSGRS